MLNLVRRINWPAFPAVRTALTACKSVRTEFTSLDLQHKVQYGKCSPLSNPTAMMRTPLQTTADLEQLRETHELECKLAAGKDGKGELPHDFWKSYAAMANTNGGVILLGVKEKGGTFSLQSIGKPDRILTDLFNMAANKGKVSINLLTNESARVLEVDGCKLIAVEVRRATRLERPVFLNGNPLGGNCYRRLHEGDHRLSDEEVKLMLGEQQHDSLDDELLAKWASGFGPGDFKNLSADAHQFESRPPLERIRGCGVSQGYRGMETKQGDRRGGPHESRASDVWELSKYPGGVPEFLPGLHGASGSEVR
ncbi:MAG: ATP-binding protein [Verrucomicrobiaceae bacterium]|nr:MAG: ATP-binding protein [Verrucomicrobiaceae bacterium]